jgi:hypothetical protein
MKRVVLAMCMVGLMAAAGIAEMQVYTFIVDQSSVLQTGGIAGIHRKYSVSGRFQLSVDFTGGAAWFDWVDATLSESQFLQTRDLGELFNMVDLLGQVVSPTQVEFNGVTADNIKAAIHIVAVLSSNSAHLTGEITPPCCDMFNYNLDAVAQLESIGWSYRYFDDFSTDKASQDSFTHSAFWPGEAFPPAEPYLYYVGNGSERQLVFTGYRGQPAHIGYCFPIGQGRLIRPIKGNLSLDVHSAANADKSDFLLGYLLFSLSEDGVSWSLPKSLGLGHHNIPISSLQGSCYVVFLGTGFGIDNLDVRLYRPAATIHVPGDLPTIQQAIDNAGNGDIIEVAPGVYTGNGNWDIDFRGKAITVRSTDGPDKTIIDCGGLVYADSSVKSHRGFYFHQNEKSDSVLCGFTIRAGKIHGSEIPAENIRWNLNPSNPVGGGIYCEFSSPSIINCVIRDCGAELGGGIGCVGAAAVFADCLIENCSAGGLGPAKSGGFGAGIGLIRSSDVKINNCIIRSNSGYYNSQGGGVYCRNSNAFISQSDISSNITQGSIQGGGLYCSGSSRLTVQQCVISNNSADAGAGVFTQWTDVFGGGTDGSDGAQYSFRTYVRLTNCTIAHNRLSGPQMPPFPGGGVHSLYTDIVVKNSIIWYNEGTPVFIIGAASKSPVVYSDIERGFLGQGNISLAPLFVPTDVPDYHLQSIYGRWDPRMAKWVIDNNQSPCIDAGDPMDPVGCEPAPNGGRINMGAYGGTSQASKGMAHLVYHVDGINGNDLNNGLSKENAFATIRKAITAARDGDTIMVWPGVYLEEVAFNRKAITIQSASDAAVVVSPKGYAFSFFGAESSMSILRNFVIRNCGEGAIFCNGASPTLTNLTIVDNQFGIAAYDGAEPDITNCILWDNDKGDLFGCKARYSCLKDKTALGGEGNISKDPLFADPKNNDYHLQSCLGRYWPEHNVWVIDENTSPCIDAGDPRIYPVRERMPNGGRINMGAYGGTPFAAMSDWPFRGDINRDGVVNMRDFAEIAETWLEALPWAGSVVPSNAIEPPIGGLEIPAIEDITMYGVPDGHMIGGSDRGGRRSE